VRVVFMGTPAFALPSLEALSGSQHRVLAVVTGRDVESGRGQKVAPPPVKLFAEKLGLPILQPASLKDPEFLAEVRRCAADIFVVVAFRILPPALINIPARGAINLHASLLPKYRGAAPINWAIINGESETGVTVFQIRPQVDTGAILSQQIVKITPDDTAGSLAERLALEGAELLVATLDGLEAGRLQGRPQDETLATPAPKIFPELGEIDWYKDAMTLKFLIHGLAPEPGAFTFWRGRRLKILKAATMPESATAEPGTLVLRDKNSIGIQTSQGLLLPLELQLEGRRLLPVREFLSGFNGRVGERFAA